MALLLADHPTHTARRRRAVTMLCFLMVSTMVMGVSTYLDSVSLHTWNELTDVGPYGMRALGEGIEDYEEEIRALPKVASAALTMHALGCLRLENEPQYRADNYLRTGKGYSLDQDYLENFPSVFNLVAGRFPESDVEIAVPGYVAEEANVWIGSQMYFSPYVEVGLQPVIVVGVYIQEQVERALNFYRSIAVVVPSLLNPDATEYSLCVDIDRSQISPFDATGALRFLEQVELDIISLDPGYIEELRYSKFHVSDYLASSVEEYVGWVSTVRLEQIARGQILLLLGMLLALMVTRYNFEERHEEIRILLSRGASGFQAYRKVLGEIVAFSLIGSGLAILLGGLVSRIAAASVGFMEFDLSLFVTEPFLISIESIVLSLVLGAVLPISGFIIYRMQQPRTTPVEKERGRLAKLTGGLRLLRWDFLVVISSSVFMVILHLGGTEIRTNPLILVTQFFIPMILFVGIASLTIKVMTRMGQLLSKALSNLVGTFSASVGARRVGRSKGMTGPVVLTLVLAMLLVVNGVATSPTVASTQLVHTRFAMGADVIFRLKTPIYYMWPEFANSVEDHPLCANGTFVTVGSMSLSEASGEAASFVAVSPIEYSHIGYDHEGVRLDQSYMNQLLGELETSPTGALITEDISQAYQLEVGDSLRAFSLGTEDESAEFNILGVVPAIPAPMIPGAALDTTVGLGRVLLNIHYVESRIDIVHAASNYLCVGTVEGANSTVLIQDLREEYGVEFVEQGYFGAVSTLMETYTGQASYSRDSAIDSMLTVISVAPVLGAVAVYEMQLARSRRREIALLKSIGAKSRELVRVHLAEVLTIAILSFPVLLVFGSIYMAGSLEFSFMKYQIWSYSFPIPIFLHFSWALSLSLFLIICGSAILGSLLLFSVVHDRGWRYELDVKGTGASYSEGTG
ncbi:MAG: FtsX-like permease family protein [Promethearchaeota archaeon]